MARQPAANESFKDYYEALHLHPDADAAMVDQAYWHLARLYNQAIPSDSTAKAQLDELNEAYAVLRSPQMRREYDHVRAVLLADGQMPASAEQEPERVPLAVMAKQKPKPRKAQPKPPAERRSRFVIQQLPLPPWQSAVTAVVVVAIAGAALAAGTEPALVAALLVVGLAFSTLPLLRKLPRLPEIPRPSIQMPSLRAPSMPERPTFHSAADSDALRQSTEAMRARWRTSTSGLDTAASEPPDDSIGQTHDAPEVPEFSAADSDSLRQSMEAIRARFRTSTSGLDTTPADSPADQPAADGPDQARDARSG